MGELKRVILECVLVGLAGSVLGFAANAVNPDGLILSRDYFYEAQRPKTPTTRPAETAAATEPAAPDTGTSQVIEPVATDDDPTEQEIMDTLWNQEGLQALPHREVAEAYEDPLHDVDLNVFIDARNDRQYAEGHIPRAFHLDPYRSERCVETIMPVVRQAQKIIVYCHGGHCEDSIYAARALLDEGADWSRLFVYAGGMSMWEAKAMPVEKGQRLSGRIVEGARP